MELTDSQFRPCRWIKRISRPVVLIGLIALYLLFVLLLFPVLGGEGMAAPLDLMFSYSPEQAYAKIESYGPEVRHSYAISAMTLDVAYPLTYSLMFSVWLSLLLKGRIGLACVLCMLPFVVLVFDLLENAGIVIMLLLFPEQLEILAIATSLATSLKWIFAVTVIFLTLALSLNMLFRIIQNQWKAN